MWRTDRLAGPAAVVAGTVFTVGPSVAGTGRALLAYDARGVEGCAGSPPVCEPLRYGVLADDVLRTGPPTVAGGVVYLQVSRVAVQEVVAFDAAGVQGCGGSPTVCEPLWQATVAPAGPNTTYEPSSLAVAGGRVYASGTDDRVHVFDAAGVEGCSGTPVQCTELWTAEAPLVCDSSEATFSCGLSPPAIVAGRMYVSAYRAGGTGGVYVFDARGTTSCSGTPTVCTPLWRADTIEGSRAAPAIADGVLVAVAAQPGGLLDVVRAFDAGGHEGCGGTPRVCAPLWESATQSSYALVPSGRPPVIANGVVYSTAISRLVTAGPFGAAVNNLYGFDLAGERNCSGEPVLCTPLFDVATPLAPVAFTAPVVANGSIFVSELSIKGLGVATVVRAFRP